MNRKEFLNLALKSILLSGATGLGGSVGYSYFGNSNYKKSFPHVK
jgi:hypothetical protein